MQSESQSLPSHVEAELRLMGILTSNEAEDLSTMTYTPLCKSGYESSRAEVTLWHQSLFLDGTPLF